jgi:hypothetical protein
MDVNVRDFGAVGDGVTDDTDAFRAALQSLTEEGGNCLVPAGTYLIAVGGVTEPQRAAVSSNVHFLGEERDVSVLKVADAPTHHLLQCYGNDWSVEKIGFDMGDFTPAGFAAMACKGTRWLVKDCAVIRSGRWGIIAFGGADWIIEGTLIQRTVPGAQPPVGAILVTADAGVWSRHGSLRNNVCQGGGITFTGDDGVIAGNRISGSGYGSGIFVQGAPSTHAPTIFGNVCYDGLSGYDDSQGGKWWSVNGFEVWAPDALIFNNIAYSNDGGGIAVGGRNSIVAGNSALDNGRYRSGYAGITARFSADAGAASGSIFIGNTSRDTRYPDTSATQSYGYREQTGGLRRVFHVGNNYSNNKIAPALYDSTQGQENVTMFDAQRLGLPARLASDMKERLFALAEDGRLSWQIRNIVRLLGG